MNLPEGTLRFVRQSLGLGDSVTVALEPLGGRGSDRAFYRVHWGKGGSSILIHYDAVRIENSYYGDIAVFLNGAGIPVPTVMGHDPRHCLMVMEDLGDRDLWSLRDAPRDIRREAYGKTLVAASRLHALTKKDLHEAGPRLMEPFGSGLYRWEREYFLTNFIRDYCGISMDPVQTEALEIELSALAARLDGAGQCLIHRDFQSQNVMVKQGEIYFIDFQGMRLGNPLYDIGSLLCDPYMEFDDGEAAEFLDLYRRLTLPDAGDSAFKTLFWEASAQRLMQALGAYGFLGLKKGLKPFLNHIPAGLRNLRKAAREAGSLPELERLLGLCG